MKLLFFGTFFILNFTISNGQPAASPLKKVLELKIPREGGANGASVSWHPLLKKYYAAMAGNVSFCLGVFDAKGKLLSLPEQTTLFDIRGLWYNPHTKTLQMNGYSDFGWAEYKLDGKGFPDSVKLLHEGVNQPVDQSVGAFDPQKDVIYFLNEDGNLDVYDFKEGNYLDEIELTLGKTKKEIDDDEDAADNYDVLDDYNHSTVVYTAISGADIGLLNYSEKEIELYNLKDGHLVRKLSLPEEAPANDLLNFSYCNSTWWLFDTKARTWIGFR